MHRTLKLAVAVLLIGGLLLGIVRLAGRDAARELEAVAPGPTISLPSPSAEARFAADAIENAPAAVPVAIEVPGGSPDRGNRWVRGKVTGRVLDQPGKPIAGASITLQPIDASARPGVRMPAAPAPELATPPAVATGADGRFTLTFDHPFVCEIELLAESRLSLPWDPGLLVEADGHGLRVDRVAGWQGGARDLGDLYLLPPRPVSGVVVDEDGRPVAGVRVSVSPAWEVCPNPSGRDRTLDREATHQLFAATSAADGRFELNNAWPGVRWLSAHGKLEFDGRADIPPGDGPVDVGEVVVGPSTPIPPELRAMMASRELSPDSAADSRSPDGAVVTGRALDSDGAPLPFVWLVANLPLPTGRTQPRGVRTDEFGAFELRDGPAGLWRFTGKFIEGEVEVPAGTLRELELRARQPGVLRGTVRAFGRPLEGAEVYPFNLDSGGGKWTWQETGADGRYELQADYGPARYEVCVESPHGRRTDFEEFTHQLGWDDVIELDVDLGSAGASGVVVSANGNPVAGVIVGLERTNQGFGNGSSLTGDDGRFLVGPVAAGTWRIFARSAHGRVERELDLSGGCLLPDLRLELPADLAALRVELAGRLARRHNLGATLVLEAPGYVPLQHPIGALPATIEGLPPGEWSVFLERRSKTGMIEVGEPVRTALGPLRLVAGETAVQRIDAALLRGG